MTKSICLATYNGTKFIDKQLSSILEQLGENDEVIIVDDCSTDNTYDILNSYADNRIKVFRNEKNLRHVKSFERAISLASKEFIFLSDQDDIWVEGRLRVFEDNFLKHPEIQLITSNFHCIDDNDCEIENPLRKVLGSESLLYKKNIAAIFSGKIGYYGCAMAFRRSFVDKILPIPVYVEAHDLWLGMAGNLLKSNLHLDEKTLYHRIHQNNASNLNRSVFKKIQARLGFFKAYRELVKRTRN